MSETLSQIREFPTTIGTGPSIGPGNGKIHESVLRSYQIVKKVEDLLRANCPPSVILEIIDDLKNAPNTTKEIQHAGSN